LTGTVGYKPTYGRVSRYGLVAFASSLDQVGPIARNVEDAALLAGAISGHDPLDATSLKLPPIRFDGPTSLRGKRIALCAEMMGEGSSDGVRRAIEDAVILLRAEGAEVETVSIPSVSLGVSCYYILAPAEASSNLARFDGVRYGPRVEGSDHAASAAQTRGQLFGPEVKLRIMVGTYVLSAGYYDAFYLKAQAVRDLMRREFLDVLERYDLVLSPASPITAFLLGD
ncbi:MAG: Asp-tRNA(Asn)/Glu-tRNA(Gln) amidotransferase GatCAB subunit A, partial [Armatimonadota bacterium]